MPDSDATEDTKQSPFFTFCSVIMPPIVFYIVARHYFDVQGLRDGASGPDVGPDLYHPLAALIFGTFAASLLGAVCVSASRRFYPAFEPRFTTAILALYCVLFLASGGLILFASLGAHKAPWVLYYDR